MTESCLLLSRHAGYLWVLSQQDGVRQVPDGEWPALALQGQVVRLLGTPENAPVITWLAEQPCITYLGTPNLLQTQRERNNPRATLLAMQQIATRWISPALGGWHRLTALDTAVYALAEDVTSSACQQHPVWVALTQLPGINPQALSRLLGVIRDPRWYVDRQHPDRGSQLRAYLGLHANHEQRLPPDARARRALVRDVWYGADVLPAETNFLWRYWHLRRNELSAAKATTATSQRFVSFLRYSWLAVLQAPQQERLFDPRIFLTGDELTHFLSSVAGCRWCIGA